MPFRERRPVRRDEGRIPGRGVQRRQGTAVETGRSIGENRVVAGLHYPEDDAEGARLGKELARFLTHRATEQNSALHWLFEKAKEEWA